MATTNKRFVAKNGLDNNGNTITNVGAAGNSLGISGTGDLTIAISGTATLTVPAGSDTLVTLTGTQTLTNKTLTTPVIATISNTGTLTLPTSTDTLVGRATTDTLTNKTISGSNNTLSNIGNSSLTNSSVSYNGVSVALGASGTLYTDDISEDGSPVNLWFTNTRARAAVSATDAGGDGSFTYDSGTGVFTYTGPSATEVRAHLSAGTGLTYSSGQFAIDSTVATLTGTQTLTNKTISGADNTLSNIGNSSLTNSSITINGTSVSLGGTRTLVTDDIAEDGSPSNLWYTDTRSRAAISVTDSGGDGSLSYNSGSGVITYTGPSATEVRAHFSAGTGVTLSSGQISIGQSVGTGDNVSFAGVTADNIRVGVTAAGEIDTSTGNLTLDSTGGTTVMDDDVNITGNLLVDGNLTVSGTTVTINTTNLAVEDNMIYLNNGSTVSNPDLGFAGNYNDGTYRHAGIFRDASDGVWKFYHQYTPEPDASPYIDITHGSFALAAIQAASFTGSVTGNVTGNASTATAWQTARTLTLSGDVTGTSAAFDGSGNISITTTIAANSVALGTDTTGNYVASITNGSYITGADGGSEGAGLTLAVDATSANTASKVVARDSSGNFAAGTITAALSGNASTATTLQTARNINGVSFNGSADITVTAAAGTLSGNTLASGVTASSLTSVGTLTSLTVSGDLTIDTSTLYVDATNNLVGIGTTNPNSFDTWAKKLVVGSGSSHQGITIFSGNGASEGGHIFFADAAGGTADQIGRISYIHSSDEMQLFTNNTQQITILSSGNTGIGTASPGYKLDVNGDIRLSSTSWLYGVNAGGGTQPLIRSVGMGYSPTVYHGVQIGQTGDHIALFVNPGAIGGGSFNGGTNELLIPNFMRILQANSAGTNWQDCLTFNNSKLGIGTTSPTEYLEITGAPITAGAMIRLRDTVTAGTESFHGVYYTSSPGVDYVLGKWTSAAGVGYFQLRDQAGNRLATFDSAGNLGLGTTSPSTALHIYSTTTSAFLLVEKSTTYAVRVGVDTSNVGYFGSLNATPVQMVTNGSARMYIDTSGAVGIGTTSPGSTLSVRGSTNLGDSYGSTTSSTYITRISGYALYYDASNRYGNYANLILNADSGWTGSARRFLITNGLSSNKFAIVRSVDANTDPSINGVGGAVSSGTADFVIDNAGNVGIATTTPSVKFEVQSGPIRSSGITSGTYIELSGNLPGYAAGAYPVIKSAGTIHFAPNEKYGAFIEGNDTYFGLLNSTPAVTVLIRSNGVTYFNGGNVGINTTSPGAKLDVRGATRIYAAGSSWTDHLNLYSADNTNTWNFLVDQGASNKLRIGYNSGGPEVITCDTSGRLGVGDSSPTGKLHVTGGDAMSGSWRKTQVLEAVYPVLVLNSNNTRWAGIGYDYSNIDYGISFWTYASTEDVTAATEAFRITNRGYAYVPARLGIGTLTPSYSLHVNGYAQATGFIVEETGGTRSAFIGYTKAWLGTGTSNSLAIASETSNSINFYTNGSATLRGSFTTAGTFYVGAAIDSGAISTYVAGYNGFAAQVSNNAYWIISGLNASGTRTFYVKGSGGAYFADQVGIGTASPTTSLTVSGVIRNDSYIDAGISAGAFRFYDGTTFRGGFGTDLWGHGGSASDLTLYMTSGNLFFSNGGSKTGVYTSSGYLGIASTSASYPLDVRGTARFMESGTTYNSNVLFGNSIGAWSSGIRTYDNSDAEMRIWHINARGQIVLAVGYNGDGATSMPAASAGLFVIGDNSGTGPAVKVGIGYNSGSMRSTTTKLGVDGNIVASGNITAYGSPSDERYKYNIQPVENALHIVSQLQGVTFNWKQDTPSYAMTHVDSDIGFIAQQVREVLPDIVREDESGFLGLRERAIVPLLVEAIKELKKQLDEVKSQKH